MNQARHRLLPPAFALMLCLSGTARAQYVFDDAILPPRAVAWRLADRGFTGIARPRFDGRAYVVEAFAPNGARVRLFVDAADGAILGRQPLDPPIVALARPAPGYGWTEEDEQPRRPLRQAERLVPPGDIPMPESRGVPPRRGYVPDYASGRPEGAAGAPNRAASEPNPSGVNPEARSRQDASRKLARVGAPPLKHSEPKSSEPRAARIVPEAPQTKVPDSAESRTRPGVKPEAPVAAVEPAAPAPAVASTPAAVQPPAEGTAARPAAPTWTNPPEGRRPVRVIGGATMVPGQAEGKPDAAP